MLKQFFRSPHGAWLNLAALVYALLGWAFGIALLSADAWYANLIGVLLTGHCLTYSAYFVHEFAGKAVMVTGAGRGIGRAVARAFAAQGCRLLAVDRDAAALQAAEPDFLAAAYRVSPRTLPANPGEAVSGNQRGGLGFRAGRGWGKG